MVTSTEEKTGRRKSQATREKAAGRKTITITTKPEELKEGLFGQIILYIMEVLPRLHEERIFPRWEIRSLKYGSPQDYLIVPGVLDINYQLGSASGPSMTFDEVRKQYIQVLGDDWRYMNMLWNTYFRIPQRVVSQAAKFGDLSGALGIHFRGTDKNREVGQTNPVSQEDLLILTRDFLGSRPEIDTLFVASDEFDFVRKVESTFPRMKVMNTGEVTLFWDLSDESKNPQKGDHAMLDCLLLSRCAALLKCQSALSGFAKVLNPRLQAYRISANKMTVDIPYFPDAYFPRYESEDPVCRKILSRLFRGDWLNDRRSRRRFGEHFRTMDRTYEMPRPKVSRRFKRWLSGLP